VGGGGEGEKGRDWGGIYSGRHLFYSLLPSIKQYDLTMTCTSVQMFPPSLPPSLPQSLNPSLPPTQMPIDLILEKYGFDKKGRGAVERLQESAAKFAAMVAAFCERLGWSDLEFLITRFHSRYQQAGSHSAPQNSPRPFCSTPIGPSVVQP
jgi:hypothetical protein